MCSCKVLCVISCILSYFFSSGSPSVEVGDGGRREDIMTTSVRLCLLYNHFRLDIIAFKVDNCSTENA